MNRTIKKEFTYRGEQIWVCYEDGIRLTWGNDREHLNQALLWIDYQRQHPTTRIGSRFD